MRRITGIVREDGLYFSRKAAAVRFAKDCGFGAKAVLEVDAGVCGVGWLVAHLRNDFKLEVPCKSGAVMVCTYDQREASPKIERESYTSHWDRDRIEGAVQRLRQRLL